MDFRTRYQYNPKTDLIGRGGFAKVYKAYDTIRECTIALKFFKSDISEKYDLVSEIKRVINFEHPNICRYYDIAVLQGANHMGEEERTEVGIMEYMDSGDIRSFIKQHPQHRDKLLKDVLHGLAFLHQNQLVHRDLKPNNILIKNTPIGPVAKITDFGISKAVNSVTTTKSSELLGTIEFMAPEQFNAKKYGLNGKLSTNLDLWSWGCLAYEIIRGESLFGSREKGEPTEQIMSNILQEDYEPKLNALADPYRQAVRMCLVKEASKRAQRAEDIIEVLEGKRKEIFDEKTRVIDQSVAWAEAGKQTPKPIKQQPFSPPVNLPTRQLLTKKKSWIFIAAIAAITLIGYLAWNQLGNGREDFEFTKTANGLEYKIFGGDGDSVVEYGSLVKLSESYYYGDSLISNDSIPLVHKIDSVVQDPELVQIILKAKKRDSIVIRMSVDILIKNGAKIPYAQKGKYFISRYKVWDIMSDTAIAPELVKNSDSIRPGKVPTPTPPRQQIEDFGGKSQVESKKQEVTRKVSLHGLQDRYKNEFDYYGTVKAEVPDGYGVANFKNGDKYEGEWKHGHLSGNGTFSSKDMTYVGQWKNSYRHGQGTWIWEGNRYVGQFKDGYRNGQGSQTWKDGSTYTGQWKANRWDGYGINTDRVDGILNCPRCVTYKGYWINGFKNGIGRCYDRNNNLLYEGQFKDDKPTDWYPNQ